MTVGESWDELPGDELAPDPTVRTCAAPGCENTFTVGSRGFAAQRKFCDEHKTTKKKDKAPRSVSVNVNTSSGRRGGGKDKEIEAVRAQAGQLLTLVQIVLLSLGQPDDATDVGVHKQAVADAVAELARYEDWLRRLASGGETTARAMAWVGVVAAAVGMLVPILARHNVIPANLAQMVGSAVPAPPMPQSEHVVVSQPGPEQPAPAGVA